MAEEVSIRWVGETMSSDFPSKIFTFIFLIAVVIGIDASLLLYKVLLHDDSLYVSPFAETMDPL